MCHPTALLATLLLCLLFPFPTQAQESDFIPDEDMLEADDDAFDPQEVLERLEALRRHPLDPNRASFSQLQQIPYLSASQIRGILDRRKKDKFERLADLLQAEGMDPGTLARTRPFLRIRPVRRNRSHLRSRGAITLPLARGFGEGHYWGDPFKIYLRLNLSVNEHLRMGILSEKDPGEQEVLDHRSLFVQLESIGPLQRAVAGDFALEFGQGLVLWTGGGSAGGARSPSDIKRRGRGIRPYISTDENLGLRGIAAACVLGPVELSLFFSRALLDASLEGDGARNFYRSGLHRTQGEMEKKHVLGETLLGGHLSGRFSQDRVVGLTWYSSRYRPGLIVPDHIRSRYAFRGDVSQVWGGHFDLVFGPLGLFGEIASNQRGALGLLLGLLLDSASLRTTLVCRHYPPDFCNPHGAALAAKEDQNESGMLLGLAWRPATGSRLELLVDGYRRFWRSYQLEMPSAGGKWSLQLVQKLGSRTMFTFRHREQHGDVAVAFSPGMGKNVRRHQRGRRFQLDWKASRMVEVRGRLETNRVFVETKGYRERGALLLAQLKFVPGKAISLRGMIVFFRAPTYDARMYVCEVGPAGVARNVALFGRGSRVFLVLKVRVIKGLEISARFCSIHYDDRQSIGHGLQEIGQNVKREAMIQLDGRW